MDDKNWLSERFEDNRAHLKAVAYRIVGSSTEADDAVQEAWLRLNRSGAADVTNLAGWLTTVVARVCLDMLRSRKARREEPLEDDDPPPSAASQTWASPEEEAMLADSVGLALLVVLDRLEPAERLAFVLHDMFDLSFDEIAPVVGRSSAAARQLASRARRRVKGGHVAHTDLADQRRVVDAYLAAVRGGNFEALLAVLDPNVVLKADGAGVKDLATRIVRGAANVATQALAAPERARYARPALVDGVAGIVVAPYGRLLLVVKPTIVGARIVEIEVIADPARFGQLELALLEA